MAPKKKAAAKKAPKKPTAQKPLTTSSFPKKDPNKPPVYDLGAGESLPGPFPEK